MDGLTLQQADLSLKDPLLQEHSLVDVEQPTFYPRSEEGRHRWIKPLDD